MSEREPIPEEKEKEVSFQDEWWKLGDSGPFDTPISKERRGEEQSLSRIESEIIQALGKEKVDRHEINRLRERRTALEAKRAIRELTTFSPFDDRETREYLRATLQRLNENRVAFEKKEDLQ